MLTDASTHPLDAFSGASLMEAESRRESWLTFLLPLALILGLALLLNLDLGPTRDEPELHNALEPWLEVLIGYLAAVAEMAAAGVIGVGVLKSIWYYLRSLLAPSRAHTEQVQAIRLTLGQALTLGLEFTVASDILRTAVAPSRQEILNLATIVLLRTLLNFFLEREIHQVEARSQPSSPT
jgi:uncharacterized membrane protein